MAGATTLYFPEVGPQWQDWVQVTNVGTEPTRVTAIARHARNGQPTWSEEKTIQPFECWTPNVEAIKENSSMQFSADQPIVAERHMHRGTNVLDFIGASPRIRDSRTAAFLSRIGIRRTRLVSGPKRR